MTNEDPISGSSNDFSRHFLISGVVMGFGGDGDRVAWRWERGGDGDRVE